MKQLFESVKSKRPTLSNEDEIKVEGLANRIINQLSIDVNRQNEDHMLLKDRPILKFCAIVDVEKVLQRDGIILDSWVDDTTPIPTLNFKVREY